MSTFGEPWALCGGWAVDTWSGLQTREHHDVDIVVFDDSQHLLFEHLAGWRLVAHDMLVDPATEEPWDGRPLVLPAHIHAPAAPGSFELEFVLNERHGSDWLLSGAPRLTRPIEQCIATSAHGTPLVLPELLLFYKAKDLRPHDEADFRTITPHLSIEQRAWLHGALSLVQPGHPWLDGLQ